MKTLPRSFYAADAVTVARALLGKLLVVSVGPTPGNGPVGGIIVETEAYTQDDPASHSFGGPRGRNVVMFGRPGRAYVYTSYGVHACLNAVCGADGTGEAVLIRALRPLFGVATQWQRRYAEPAPEELAKLEQSAQPARPPRRVREIAAGPGRLTQALGITTADNGASLQGPRLVIMEAEAVPERQVRRSARIGISKAKERPWRFTIAGSAFLSRPESRPQRS